MITERGMHDKGCKSEDLISEQVKPVLIDLQ